METRACTTLKMFQIRSDIGGCAAWLLPVYPEIRKDKKVGL